MKTKKAQLANAPNTVLTFVVIAIIIAVTGMVLGGVRDTFTANTGGNTNQSAAWNATYKGLLGSEKFSQFLPTIAIVLVAALLIAIVVGAFVYFRQ